MFMVVSQWDPLDETPGGPQKRKTPPDVAPAGWFDACSVPYGASVTTTLAIRKTAAGVWLISIRGG
jgi:hypothetical protein